VCATLQETVAAALAIVATPTRHSTLPRVLT
jgi:hypothetical protein